ncbi:MAG: peptidylprolyl isomerase, partial [Pseudomonadota bacterium]
MSKLLREPLLHFLVLGVLIFVAFNYLQPEGAESTASDRVVITDADVERLAAQYEDVWLRAPTADETKTLIQNLVREEILVQEALKLGMEQDDAVIRRRLTQKMDFLLSSLAATATPDEEELQALYSELESTLTNAGQVAFENIYLGEAPAEADVASALELIESNGPSADVGQATLLPARVPLSTARQIDAVFGNGFGDALLGLEPGAWIAPVRSSFGVHVVRVTEIQEATLPPLEDLRTELENEWRRRNAADFSDEFIQNLQDQYEIVLRTTEDQTGQ